MKTKCLKLLSDYELITMNHEAKGVSVAPMTFNATRNKCAPDGSVAVITEENLNDIRFLFEIWRHDVTDGDIWVKIPGAECGVIQVNKAKVKSVKDTSSAKHIDHRTFAIDTVTLILSNLDLQMNLTLMRMHILHKSGGLQ